MLLTWLAAFPLVACADVAREIVAPVAGEILRDSVSVEALALDRRVVFPAEVLTAQVALVNSGDSAVQTSDIVLAARQAAGTSELSFTLVDAPSQLESGGRTTITATLPLEEDVPPGTYLAFAKIHDGNGNWSEQSPVSFEVQSAPTSVLGANLISLGNQYVRTEYGGEYLTDLLSTLKQHRFGMISIRVIWRMMEPARGAYDERNVLALDRILAQADTLRLDVMLDFHTLFDDRNQSWQAPAWLADIAPEATINGEIIAAGSMKHVFYNADVLGAYVAMQRHVIEALQDHSSLKYISLLNEPYLNWESQDNVAYFDAALATIVEDVREATDKPVGVRWIASWNPWSDEAHKRIGASLWRSLDFVAINLYFDPTNDAQRVDNTEIWPMALRARQDALEAELPFIVSEVGTTMPDAGSRRDYWSAVFERRLRPLRPDAVMIWNGQNDGDFYPTKADSFNFLSGPGQFADYALQAIIGQGAGSPQ